MREGDKPTESLEWFAKAIGVLAAVYEREPGNVYARQNLGISYWNRAVAHDRLEKYAEAITDWDKAIELSPKDEQSRIRAARAISRIRAGQLDQGVAEVAELAKSPNTSGAEWYDLACAYAVASGKVADKKDEYATRALELLRQAVKAGYKDAAHMKTDIDLDALRDRDDFKKLVAELDVKAAGEKKGK